MNDLLASKSKLKLRTIAAVVIISLLITQNASAGIPFPQIIRFENKDLLFPSLGHRTFSIPESFATIEESFQGKGSDLVIYIQDAHANYSAQKNIAGIIQYLSDNFGFKLITVEAAEGEVDTEIFRAFPAADITKNILDRHMRRGEIAGPQFAAATSKLQLQLSGIDQHALYTKNLAELLSVIDLSEKEGAESVLRRIRTYLKNITDGCYPHELKSLQTAVENSKNGSDLLTAIHTLGQLARHENIQGEPFPTIKKIVSLSETKPSINSTKLIQDMNARTLFDEIETLAVSLKMKMAAGSETRKLVRFEEYLRLLEAGLRIGLSRKEAKLFEKFAGEFKARATGTFLEKQNTRLRLKQNKKIPADLASLDVFAEKINAFYKTAASRERLFVKNLRKEMAVHLEHKAVLVTGGFHKAGVIEKLRAADISYVVINPRITENPAQENYLDLMLKQSALLNLPRVSTVAPFVPLARSTVPASSYLVTSVVAEQFKTLHFNPAAYGFGSANEALAEWKRNVVHTRDRFWSERGIRWALDTWSARAAAGSKSFGQGPDKLVEGLKQFSFPIPPLLRDRSRPESSISKNVRADGLSSLSGFGAESDEQTSAALRDRLHTIHKELLFFQSARPFHPLPRELTRLIETYNDGGLATLGGHIPSFIAQFDSALFALPKVEPEGLADHWKYVARHLDHANRLRNNLAIFETLHNLTNGKWPGQAGIPEFLDEWRKQRDHLQAKLDWPTEFSMDKTEIDKVFSLVDLMLADLISHNRRLEMVPALKQFRTLTLLMAYLLYREDELLSEKEIRWFRENSGDSELPDSRRQPSGFGVVPDVKTGDQRVAAILGTDFETFAARMGAQAPYIWNRLKAASKILSEGLELEDARVPLSKRLFDDVRKLRRADQHHWAIEVKEIAQRIQNLERKHSSGFGATDGGADPALPFKDQVIKLFERGLDAKDDSFAIHGTSIEAVRYLMRNGRLSGGGEIPGQLYIYRLETPHSAVGSGDYAERSAIKHFIMERLSFSLDEKLYNELSSFAVDGDLHDDDVGNLIRTVQEHGITVEDLENWRRQARKEGRKGVQILLSKDAEKYFAVREGAILADAEYYIEIPDGLPIEFIAGIEPLGDYEFDYLESLSEESGFGAKTDPIKSLIQIGDLLGGGDYERAAAGIEEIFDFSKIDLEHAKQIFKNYLRRHLEHISIWRDEATIERLSLFLRSAGLEQLMNQAPSITQEIMRELFDKAGEISPSAVSLMGAIKRIKGESLEDYEEKGIASALGYIQNPDNATIPASQLVLDELNKGTRLLLYPDFIVGEDTSKLGTLVAEHLLELISKGAITDVAFELGYYQESQLENVKAGRKFLLELIRRYKEGQETGLMSEKLHARGFEEILDNNLFFMKTLDFFLDYVRKHSKEGVIRNVEFHFPFGGSEELREKSPVSDAAPELFEFAEEVLASNRKGIFILYAGDAFKNKYRPHDTPASETFYQALIHKNSAWKQRTKVYAPINEHNLATGQRNFLLGAAEEIDPPISSKFGFTLGVRVDAKEPFAKQPVFSTALNTFDDVDGVIVFRKFDEDDGGDSGGIPFQPEPTESIEPTSPVPGGVLDPVGGSGRNLSGFGAESPSKKPSSERSGEGGAEADKGNTVDYSKDQDLTTIRESFNPKKIREAIDELNESRKYPGQIISGLLSERASEHARLFPRSGPLRSAPIPWRVKLFLSIMWILIPPVILMSPLMFFGLSAAMTLKYPFYVTTFLLWLFFGSKLMPLRFVFKINLSGDWSMLLDRFQNLVEELFHLLAKSIYLNESEKLFEDYFNARKDFWIEVYSSAPLAIFTIAWIDSFLPHVLLRITPPLNKFEVFCGTIAGMLIPVYFMLSPLLRKYPKLEETWRQYKAADDAESKSAAVTKEPVPKVRFLESGAPYSRTKEEKYSTENITALIPGLGEIPPQSGGFLGIGSFHNLDIALDRNADAVVLLDRDREVTELNLKLLRLVESTERFDEIYPAVQKLLEAEGLMTAEFFEQYVNDGSVMMGRTPLSWAKNQKDFSRLKELINKGKVAVAHADLTIPESLKKVGRFFNEAGTPLAVISLSDVEGPGYALPEDAMRKMENIPAALAQAGAHGNTLIIASSGRSEKKFKERFGKIAENIRFLKPHPVPAADQESQSHFVSHHYIRTFADMQNGQLFIDSLQPGDAGFGAARSSGGRRGAKKKAEEADKNPLGKQAAYGLFQREIRAHPMPLGEDPLSASTIKDLHVDTLFHWGAADPLGTYFGGGFSVQEGYNKHWRPRDVRVLERVNHPMRNRKQIENSHENIRALLRLTPQKREELTEHLRRYYQLMQIYTYQWHHYRDPDIKLNLHPDDPDGLPGEFFRQQLPRKALIYLSEILTQLEFIHGILTEAGFFAKYPSQDKIGQTFRDKVVSEIRKHFDTFPTDEKDIPGKKLEWYRSGKAELFEQSDNMHYRYQDSEALLSPFWVHASGLFDALKEKWPEKLSDLRRENIPEDLGRRIDAFRKLESAVMPASEDKLAGFTAHLKPVFEDIEFALAGVRMIEKGGYSLPEGTDEPGVIQLIQAWNPVAGTSDKMDKLDIDISSAANLFGITGPNEIGKSTTIEMIALCVLYYQMGLPVPAAAAKIGVFRNIYTVTPSFEGVEPGESHHTGLVKRLATLINEAGPRDLILIDEAHMGSEYKDLVAISSVLMQDLKDTGATILYATHLKDVMRILEKSRPGVKPVELVMSGEEGLEKKVRRRLVPGIAKHSLAVQTLEKLGFPPEIIRWMKEYAREMVKAGLVSQANFAEDTEPPGSQKPRIADAKYEFSEDREILFRVLGNLFIGGNASDLFALFPLFPNLREIYPKWTEIDVPTLERWRTVLFNEVSSDDIEVPPRGGNIEAYVEVLNRQRQKMISDLEPKIAVLKEIPAEKLMVENLSELVTRWEKLLSLLKDKPFTVEGFSKSLDAISPRARGDAWLVRDQFEALKQQLQGQFDRILIQIQGIQGQHLYEDKRLKLIYLMTTLVTSAAKNNLRLAERAGEGESFSIKNARSPFIPADAVVPVDLVGDSKHPQFIIAGPHKSGKTSVIRLLQALLLMDKFGLPVPAEMKIPGYDRILTFFGAEERMATGQSYFNRVAGRLLSILLAATSKSIVLMDELHGSDYWELSALQAAVIKYLDKVGATVVLVTHMREGLSVARDVPSIKFLKTDVTRSPDGEIQYHFSLSDDSELKSQSLGIETVKGFLQENNRFERALALREEISSAGFGTESLGKKLSWKQSAAGDAAKEIRFGQKETGEKSKLISPASSYDDRVADSASRRNQKQRQKRPLESKESSSAILHRSYDFTSDIFTTKPEQKDTQRHKNDTSHNEHFQAKPLLVEEISSQEGGYDHGDQINRDASNIFALPIRESKHEEDASKTDINSQVFNDYSPYSNSTVYGVTGFGAESPSEKPSLQKNARADKPFATPRSNGRTPKYWGPRWKDTVKSAEDLLARYEGLRNGKRSEDDEDLSAVSPAREMLGMRKILTGQASGTAVIGVRLPGDFPVRIAYILNSLRDERLLEVYVHEKLHHAQADDFFTGMRFMDSVFLKLLTEGSNQFMTRHTIRKNRDLLKSRLQLRYPDDTAYLHRYLDDPDFMKKSKFYPFEFGLFEKWARVAGVDAVEGFHKTASFRHLAGLDDADVERWFTLEFLIRWLRLELFHFDQRLKNPAENTPSAKVPKPAAFEFSDETLNVWRGEIDLLKNVESLGDLFAFFQHDERASYNLTRTPKAGDELTIISAVDRIPGLPPIDGVVKVTEQFRRRADTESDQYDRVIEILKSHSDLVDEIFFGNYNRAFRTIKKTIRAKLERADAAPYLWKSLDRTAASAENQSGFGIENHPIARSEKPEVIQAAVRHLVDKKNEAIAEFSELDETLDIRTLIFSGADQVKGFIEAMKNEEFSRRFSGIREIIFAWHQGTGKADKLPLKRQLENALPFAHIFTDNPTLHLNQLTLESAALLVGEVTPFIYRETPPVVLDNIPKGLMQTVNAIVHSLELQQKITTLYRQAA